MNLNELAPSWRKQNESQGRLSADALAGIVRRAERARWTNWLMGAIGFVAAFDVAWNFGHRMMNDPSMLAQAGAAMCVLAALAVVLAVIRDLWPIRSTGESTCNYFSQELRRTEKLIASNKSPLIYAALFLINIGLLLIAIGGLPNLKAVLVIAATLALDIVMVWAARMTVRRAEQRRVDLEAVLAEFREDVSAT